MLAQDDRALPWDLNTGETPVPQSTNLEAMDKRECMSKAVALSACYQPRCFIAFMDSRSVARGGSTERAVISLRASGDNL